MPNETDTLAQREQRLQEVVLEYLHAVDSGRAPTPNDVVTRYPDLAAELTAFFTDQEGLGSLLSPLRRLAPTPPAPAPVPTHLGDYEILEVIGRGGMGVVYRARQMSLNRLVAVKVLRDRALASPVELDRFRREAESAAHLDHPNIAPIYEVGEHAGQLYFSMKLIEGGSLAQHLSEPRPHLSEPRPLGSGGANQLLSEPRPLGSGGANRSLTVAARMVATVARAVHHAHQRGILHRDLKPSNILLDSQGVPYVTDFGLAKRLEGNDCLTLSGTVVGTPEYLAPEQAQAAKRLTTAADVYSLGVVLYELLTGRVPFRGENAWHTLRQVVEQEPAPVRHLAPEVDRDLETICQKCLAKDPERRYGSAEALAEDLECWLARMPIAARPAGRLERAWRWCRRKPAQAGLAAALLLLAIVMVVAPTISLVLLHAEQERTKDALKDQARRRQQARDAMDLLAASVIGEWLEKQPSLANRHKKFLATVLANYQEFTNETATDEPSRAGLALAYFRIGDIQRILGQMAEAEEAYTRSEELYTQLLSETGGWPAYRKELIRIANHRIQILTALGRTAESEAALADMVRVQKQWGIDSLDSDGRDWMGISLINLSVLSRNRGNYEEADALASEALALYTELMKEAPRNSSRHSALMYGQTRALTQHAGGLVFKQQYEAAEKIYREALTEQAMLGKRFPQLAEVREDLAQTHEMLADLLKATQRPGEAEAALREAIQVRQQLCKDFPGRPAPSIALAHNQYKLGAVLASRDRPTEAEEAYRSAMALYEQLAAKWPKNDTYLAGLTAAQERLQELRKQTSRP